MVNGRASVRQMTKNPLRIVPRYRQPRHVAVWVRDSRTLGEVLGVLNALRHTSVELLGVLLANSGLRNSDVVGLKWCDSNFEKPALLVDSLIREIDLPLVLGPGDVTPKYWLRSPWGLPPLASV